MLNLGLQELVVLLIIGAFSVIPIIGWWRIFRRVGNSPGLSLLMLVPLVNLALLLWFAFAEWPIERQLKALTESRSPQS